MKSEVFWFRWNQKMKSADCWFQRNQKTWLKMYGRLTDRGFLRVTVCWFSFNKDIEDFFPVSPPLTEKPLNPGTQRFFRVFQATIQRRKRISLLADAASVVVGVVAAPFLSPFQYHKSQTITQSTAEPNRSEQNRTDPNTRDTNSEPAFHHQQQHQL